MFNRLKKNLPIGCFVVAIVGSIVISLATSAGILVLIVLAIRWLLNAGVGA